MHGIAGARRRLADLNTVGVSANPKGRVLHSADVKSWGIACIPHRFKCGNASFRTVFVDRTIDGLATGLRKSKSNMGSIHFLLDQKVS